MYYDFFGLDAPPFKITPDTHLFYSGGKRGLILEALIYAIKNGEGIIKVVGEVGSGKTMLCRMLEEQLPQQIEIVYLVHPHVSPEKILYAIAFEMQLAVTPQEEPLHILHKLQMALLKRHASNQQTVVFIEEAQAMPLETLEEIRLLSNLETTRNKLLQIVLFGQPELDVHLAVTSIRQLRERITHSFYLPDLTQSDIAHYIAFRLSGVGYRGPPLFSNSALRLMTIASQGLIRRINILADKALLAAFAKGHSLVTAQHLRLAIKDSGYLVPAISFKKYFGILMILSMLGFSFFIFNSDLWITEKSSEKLDFSQLNSPILPVSLFEQRVQATQQWLHQASTDHYTIQLTQTTEDKLDDLSKLFEKEELKPILEHLYVYRTRLKGNIVWRVVYHEFVDKTSALEAIATLPEIVRRYQPFIRTIQSVQDGWLTQERVNFHTVFLRLYFTRS